LPYIDILWYKDVYGQLPSDKDTRITEFPQFRNKYYYFGNNIFYFDDRGDITHRVKLESGILASMSKLRYVLYQKVGKQISLYSRSGYKLWVMDTYAYPFLSETGNRFLLLSTDNTSISLYDQNKNNIIPKRFISSMILDFTFCHFNDNLLIGTSEGVIHYYSYNGERIAKTQIKGSKYNYIKSVSISYHGKYLACLSGLYPEMLSVFNHDGKLLWQKPMDINRRRRVSIYLDEINQLSFVQGSSGIIVSSLKNGRNLFELNLSYFNFDKIFYVKYHSSKNYILCLVTTNDDNIALFINKKGDILWKKIFTDRYFLYGELSKEHPYVFLIQTSQAIYCYALNFLKS